MLCSSYSKGKIDYIKYSGVSIKNVFISFISRESIQSLINPSGNVGHARKTPLINTRHTLHPPPLYPMPIRQEHLIHYLPTQGRPGHHSPHNPLILYPPHATTTHRRPNVALERFPILSQIVGGLLVQRIGSIRFQEEELSKVERSAKHPPKTSKPSPSPQSNQKQYRKGRKEKDIPASPQ